MPKRRLFYTGIRRLNLYLYFKGRYAVSSILNSNGFLISWLKIIQIKIIIIIIIIIIVIIIIIIIIILILIIMNK